MSARTVRRCRLAAGLGLAGGLIGVAAGLTQATVGQRIPQWSGAKQAPVALGLLTVALSLVAVLAAARQHRTDLSVGERAGCAFALAGPGLVTVEAFAVAALHTGRGRAAARPSGHPNPAVRQSDRSSS